MSRVSKMIMGFNIRKLPKYLSHIGKYKNLLRDRHDADKKDKRQKRKELEQTQAYNKYVHFMKQQGVSFGIVSGGQNSGGGTEYVHPLSDVYIPSCMYKEKKTYSQDDIDLFFQLATQKFGEAQSGAIFCDIGANIGTTTVYVSKNWSPHVNVIAFEPDGLNCRVLRANVVLNGCKDVTVVNNGVSDKAGKVTFLIDERNRGGSSILTELNKDRINASGITVSSIQNIVFDQWLGEHAGVAENIRFLWMDVEGHEPHVINGMRHFMGTHKVPLFMEFTTNAMSKEDFALLFDVLHTVYRGFYAIVTPKDISEHQINELHGLYERGVWKYGINIMFY